MVLQYFIHSFFIKSKAISFNFVQKTTLWSQCFAKCCFWMVFYEWRGVEWDLSAAWSTSIAPIHRRTRSKTTNILSNEHLSIKGSPIRNWALQIKSQHNGAKNTRPIQDLLQSRCTWSASKSWPVQSYWFIDFAVQSTICHVSKFHRPKLTCI